MKHKQLIKSCFSHRQLSAFLFFIQNKIDVLGAKLDKEELRKTNIDISVMALDWH
jgi:hypothetical protein